MRFRFIGRQVGRIHTYVLKHGTIQHDLNQPNTTQHDPKSKTTRAHPNQNKNWFSGFLRATADFRQHGIQAKGVDGHLLDNGNFIFLWRDGGYFKMVLTNNDGTKIKNGYLSDPGTTWKDTNTWNRNKDAYSISNFTGRTSMFCHNFL